MFGCCRWLCFTFKFINKELTRLSPYALCLSSRAYDTDLFVVLFFFFFWGSFFSRCVRTCINWFDADCRGISMYAGVARRMRNSVSVGLLSME